MKRERPIVLPWVIQEKGKTSYSIRIFLEFPFRCRKLILYVHMEVK